MRKTDNLMQVLTYKEKQNKNDGTFEWYVNFNNFLSAELYFGIFRFFVVVISRFGYRLMFTDPFQLSRHFFFPARFS